MAGVGRRPSSQRRSRAVASGRNGLTHDERHERHLARRHGPDGEAEVDVVVLGPG